jgi:hypothetical protein
MNLPDVQRGMAILADHIQRLNSAIRQIRVRPGVGYLIKESNGGTSLVIQSGRNGGGGNGGIVCEYFEVTDASDETGLKVKVAQNLIAGRYPDGMGIDFPDFILEISGNSYIYACIYWDIENLVIGPDSDAITILQSSDLLQNTDTLQYILLATIETGGDPLAITTITNVCSEPVPNPCLLDWTA